jgi:hypothetical protein
MIRAGGHVGGLHRSVHVWLEMIAPRIGGGWRDPDWPLDLMRQRILQGPPPYP